MTKRLIRFIFAWSVPLTLIFSFNAFAANDYIQERAYLEDASNALTIEQVVQHPFKPYQDILSKGYSSSTFWLRLKVDKNLEDQLRVLRIQPAFLDTVEVYQQVNGRWTKKTVGDRHAYLERDWASTLFGVSVISNSEPQNIYVRLKTTSTSLIKCELLNQTDFLNKEGIRDLTIGIVLGILLVFLAWTISQTAIERDFLVILLGLFLIFQIGYQAGVLGIVSRFIFPTQPLLANNVVSLFVILFVFFIGLYNTVFVMREIPIKLLRIAFTAFTAMSIVPLSLFLFGLQGEALKINAILAAMLCLLYLSIPVYFLVSSSKKINKLFAFAYFIQGTFVLYGIAPMLNIVRADTFSLNVGVLFGMVSIVQFTFLLVVRQKEKDRISELMIASEQQARFELANEKIQRERQSQLMAMLTHELRTPLYLLRLVVDSAIAKNNLNKNANRAIKDMSDIIERCKQMDRYEGSDKSQLNLSRFDPLPVIQALVKASGKAKSIEIAVQNTQHVFTDEMLFKIMMSNLIENATKYAGVDSHIHIELMTQLVDDQSFWKFKITNTIGDAGFPDADRVFDKYYRSERAHRISGSGLGLYIVKSLVELLDGFVGYETKEEKVSFELCLPS